MHLELCIFGTGLGIAVKHRDAEFNEVWLAESLKNAWSVWAELGWNCNKTLYIDTKNWNGFGGDEVKLEVIDKIARFNRVSRRSSFDLKTEWIQGWRLILEITELIKRYDIYLESNDEIYHFRLMTAKFLAMGILKGINESDMEVSDYFIYETRKTLGSFPFEYYCNIDVTFQSDKSEAKISAIDSTLSKDSLDCNCFTVFVSKTN